MVISGKEVSKVIKEYIKNKLSVNENIEDSACLVIIRVGNDPSSIKYTNNKIKAAKACHMFPLLVEMPEDTDQTVLDRTVEEFLMTYGVNGVIVQLPLPKHLNTNKINELFNKYPHKDVDGFSEVNVGKLNLNETSEWFPIPCTAKGCIDLIEATNTTIEGKVALVLGRSNIVGKPVARLLEQKNAIVIQCHSKTSLPTFIELAPNADIVIAAIGKAGFYRTSMFPNAKVFIDVGINVAEDGKIVGDLEDDVNIANDPDRYITPVPGGVGPMTVANLLLNTYKSYELDLSDLDE